MARHSPWLVLLLGILGCSAEQDPAPLGDQNAEPTVRLVERAYPYQVDDATICAEYVIDDDATGEPVRHFEFYKLEVIRAELAADPALRRGILDSAGVTRVDDCESARRYVAARQAIMARAPAAQDEPALPAVPLERPATGEVNKLVGVDADFPPVVNLLGLGCSGFLFGPRWLVTAAHCRPSSGRFSLAFIFRQDGNNHVIKPCAHGPNSNFVQVPSFVGSGDWVNDFAVIEADCDFPSPADSPRAWVRLSLTSAWPRQFISPMGWGRNAHNGSGSGHLRRGEQGIYVLLASRYLFTSIADRRRARICRGDSGGPALSFSSLPGAPIVMGVNLYHSGTGDFCPYPGDVMGFNQIASKTAWMSETFALGCNAFETADGELRYWRCW